MNAHMKLQDIVGDQPAANIINALEDAADDDTVGLVLLAFKMEPTGGDVLMISGVSVASNLEMNGWRPVLKQLVNETEST